ncbi:MAG: HAMP domain-containing protein [Acidobacteria bacterium]|nr:HAMP domain-containing protein [Acidobacteriota bacterium]
MSLRAKLLLIFIACAAAPLLALSIYSYVSSVRAAETLLRRDAQARAYRMARRIEETLDRHEHALAEIARSTPMIDFVYEAAQAGSENTPLRKYALYKTSAGYNDPRGRLRRDAESKVSDYLWNHDKQLASITCFDRQGQPLFHVAEAVGTSGRAEVSFQTEDFVLGDVRPDERASADNAAAFLRSRVRQDAFGTGVRLTMRVPSPEPEPGDGGTLVAELKLDPIFAEAVWHEVEVIGDGRPGDAQLDTPRAAFALDDESGRIIYHTNAALKHQPASAAADFAPLAAKMRTGQSGTEFYDVPDGTRRLAVYGPVDGLGASLAVAENYTAASSTARRGGLAVIALAAIAGLAGCVLIALIVERARRRIERVAEGAAAIAGGDLDQRIDLQTSGVTNKLVENFNRMSDRLRELIAREAESKQFESFMRLSAMLTHDLKNAITGLSMLVGNMEKQFHHEEFRADAILSLREATEKLNRIVARLSEPVKSLSGEYRRAARRADLVPVIRRVLAANAEPYRALYEIEARLPETLFATVELERIEAVVENLVINALEAMGAGGGRLTVEAGSEGERFVFFSVADTGVGMSEEFIRERLFRPFATTKSRGIGLGLFTCREIVEAHGGRINVESKPGAGTRFRIVLPSSLFTSGERQRAAAAGGD